MLNFEGCSPWSLVILCGQSILINRGLYIRVHKLQCHCILVSCLCKVWGHNSSVGPINWPRNINRPMFKRTDLSELTGPICLLQYHSGYRTHRLYNCVENCAVLFSFQYTHKARRTCSSISHSSDRIAVDSSC
jgi:hypothetical protein